MQILFGVLVAISGILLVLAIRSITTFVHEMGHAIPALLFTKDEVKVYVGTYGDISKGLNIIIGRFQIFFKFNPFDWKIGMCTHKKAPGLWQNLFIILGGPIASLFISIPLMSNVTSSGSSNEVKFICMIIIVASLMDFLVNIIPSGRNIYMHDGSVGFNDGFQIKMLLARRVLKDEHLEIEKFLEQKDYDAAKEQCLINLENDDEDQMSHATLIHIYTQQELYIQALDSYRAYEKNFNLDVADNYAIGKILMNLERYNQALPHFEKVHERSFQDPYLLYNIGLIKKKQGKYTEAIKRLNGAIYYGAESVDFYLARGQVSMLMGNYEEASKDLDYAYKLKSDHPEVHYSIGKWHKQQGDKRKAFECYMNAKELGFEKDSLEYEIEEMR